MVKEEFQGYDPYDALNFPLGWEKLGKWIPVIAIQFHKRNPLNLRRFLRIPPQHNAKALGLFLCAYSLLYRRYPEDDCLANMHKLFLWLRENFSSGYSGKCWGYPFDWASSVKYLKAGIPSAVVTGFVTRGIDEYFRATGDSAARDILLSSCNFILNDLPMWRDNDKLCISYTPMMPDICYNASLLGAEVLARGYAHTGENKYLEIACRAVEFVLSRQHPDGRWNYSLDLHSGQERTQLDFHQGYVLESIHEIMRLTGVDNPRWQEALRRGAYFYRYEQFLDDGRAKWRYPKVWPVDIHNQAQGIITFTKLHYLDGEYPDFARRIAHWTIQNMQHPAGYFYYQKHRWYINRIPYMRWSQAWMMLALATFLCKETDFE